MYQNKDASRDRKRLRQILGRMEELIRALAGRDPIWRGIVYEHKRRCGKPNCRCTRGELHCSFTFADRSSVKQRNLSLSGPLLREARKMTEAYRRFRRARADLTRQLGEVRTIADRLESYRLRLGLKRLGPRLKRRGR